MVCFIETVSHPYSKFIYSGTTPPLLQPLCCCPCEIASRKYGHRKRENGKKCNIALIIGPSPFLPYTATSIKPIQNKLTNVALCSSMAPHYMSCFPPGHLDIGPIFSLGSLILSYFPPLLHDIVPIFLLASSMFV